MLPKSKSLTSRIFLKSADILICLASIGIIILILLSLLGRYPYLELIVHFRLQYAIGSLICLMLLAVFHRWLLGLLLLICAVFNAAQIVPYYFAAPHRISSIETQKIRLMTANVAEKNQNYDAFRKSVEISAPDILVLQEFTEAWNQEIEPLRSNYPYSKLIPKPRSAGLAILSRYPIESSHILFETSSYASCADDSCQS